MHWREAVENLGREFARANQFLKDLDTFPELKSTPTAARVRWAIAQAGTFLERLSEYQGDARAEVQRWLDEAEKAIRLAEKAIERASELMCLVLKAREERKRFLEDLALRLARTKLERLRATVP